MITDVPGVKVGHCTISRGRGKLVKGQGPVRTGVTAVVPNGNNLFENPVKGAFFDFNGCGGLQGSLQIAEFGMIETPIMLTNTMSMGAVSDATVKYMLRSNKDVGIDEDAIIPIVSECDDSFLNDARGLHVHEEHVTAALDDASDIVQEGAVGAGTGMTSYDFKGGIGTSSRIVRVDGKEYTVGAIVLANHGDRLELMIDGVPVGRLLDAENPMRKEHGSIVMIVGTDAPLNARQLQRLAKRTVLGLAVTGACSHNGSGDISLAFSTANVHNRCGREGLVTDHTLQDCKLSLLFRATVDSTSEAIINSLFKAETTDGRDGNVSPALPIEPTLELLRTYRHLK
jgi:D-aminopeptidase